MNYESTVTLESAKCPGVQFTVRRMSFGRRLELTRKVKERLARLEFLSAGESGGTDEAEAALLTGEIDREYGTWGLAGLEGLDIDGEEATPQTLMEKGPEPLVAEVLEAIYREAGLSEDERKNSESHSTSSKEIKPGGNATNAGA